MPTVPKDESRVPMTPNQTVQEDFKTMAYGLMRRSQEVEDFRGWKGYLFDVLPPESKPQGELAGTQLANQAGIHDIDKSQAQTMMGYEPSKTGPWRDLGKPQFFSGGDTSDPVFPHSETRRKIDADKVNIPYGELPTDDMSKEGVKGIEGRRGSSTRVASGQGDTAPKSEGAARSQREKAYIEFQRDDQERNYRGTFRPAKPGEPIEDRQGLDRDVRVAGGSEDVWKSIFQQESSSGKNISTSSTGAIGPGQIMPGTFKQWARPGENIRNYDDNIAVSKRMVESYHKQYGGDPARVAVAYFSGPGNVAPPGSPTPWKSDKSDGSVRTSQYVQQVIGRMGGSVDAAGVPQARSRGEVWDKAGRYVGGTEETPRFKPNTGWLDEIVNARRRKRSA